MRNFQIPGSGMAEMTDIPGESLFERYGRGIQARPNLQVAVVLRYADEVPQSPERDVVLKFLHMHVIAEGQEKCFQRFPNIVQGPGLCNRCCPCGALPPPGRGERTRTPLTGNCSAGAHQFQQQETTPIAALCTGFALEHRDNATRLAPHPRQAAVRGGGFTFLSRGGLHFAAAFCGATSVVCAATVIDAADSGCSQ
jgi:hypothetical protein